jgi:alanine-alpha-ketoisovalerate/valine-pyruvate aminotransferase
MRDDQASSQNNFGTEISPEKSETKATSGQDLVRCKIIVVDNKCLQKVRNLKYFGCGFSYGNGRDIQQRLSKFAQILRILNNTFKPSLVQKFSTIKVYNTLALPILL